MGLATATISVTKEFLVGTDYIETLVRRDMRDLARIRSLDGCHGWLELAAAQTARLVNLSGLTIQSGLEQRGLSESNRTKDGR